LLLGQRARRAIVFEVPQGSEERDAFVLQRVGRPNRRGLAAATKGARDAHGGDDGEAQADEKDDHRHRKSSPAANEAVARARSSPSDGGIPGASSSAGVAEPGTAGLLRRHRSIAATARADPANKRRTGINHANSVTPEVGGDSRILGPYRST